MSDDTHDPPSTGRRSDPAREQRLAAELRRNLAKRKARARAVSRSEAAQTPPPERASVPPRDEG